MVAEEQADLSIDAKWDVRDTLSKRNSRFSDVLCIVKGRRTKALIRKQGLVERCENLQKQRRAVESEVQKNNGTRLQRFLFWK